MRKFYSSFPIYVAGGLVIYLLFFRGCGGIVEVFGTAFLAFGVALYLVFYYIYSAILYFTRQVSVGLRPLLSAVITFASIGLSLFVQSLQPQKKILLRASNHQIVDINLMEDNKVEFYYGNIEEKCSCKGVYALRGDTVIIERLKKPSKFAIHDRYLITKAYLIPLSDGNKLEKDSSLYLSKRD